MTPDPAARAAPASLRIVLLLTWLNSVTTAAITVGLPYIAKAAYDFGPVANLWLGLVLGAGYIPAAFFVGPGLRRLTQRLPWLSTRATLTGVLLAMAVVGSMPWVLRSIDWIVWPSVFLYNALSGALWPIVESYLSGARRADNLRRATSIFNITWSSAGVVMAWGIAPLLKGQHALVALPVASIITAFSTLLLLAVPRDPPRHLHEDHPHPPVYESLLTVFRWLLPTSYLLMYCLNPLLPAIAERAGVSASIAAIVGSAYLASRFGAFALFAAWHGWHGRWRTPIWTTGVLLAGFGLAVTAASIPALVVGLILFGVGMGGIYAAALYYAMEVGAAEVEAGGMHETLIGCGYTFGPLVGLGAVYGASAAGRPDEAPLATVVLALTIAAIAVAIALRSARRAPRRALAAHDGGD